MTDTTAAIRGVHWSGLFHAYGSAADTPRHLVALTSGDADRVEAALDHLLGAVIHQGTAWPVTPHVVPIVVSLLPQVDPRARAVLLVFLTEVADLVHWLDVDEARAAAYPSDPAAAAEIDRWMREYAMADEEEQENRWGGEPDMAELLVHRAALDCHDLVPSLLDPVLALLADPDPEVRETAVACAWTAACHPDLAARRPAVVATLTEAAATAEPAERCVLAVAIGQLDGSTRFLLADPNPAVRVCAALSPGLESDPAATATLLAALTDPAALDAAVPRTPAQLDGQPRHWAAATVCERVPDFPVLLPAALAMAPHLLWNYPEPDVAPFLARAFPDGWPATPTEAQRTYAHALAAHPEFWDPRRGTRESMLRTLGLPDDQAAWAAL